MSDGGRSEGEPPAGGEPATWVRKARLTLATTLVVMVAAVAVEALLELAQRHSLRAYDPFHTLIVAVLVGGPIGWFWIAQRTDAAALRDTAQAALRRLRETEDRLSLLADHASDVFISITPDGRITYVSPSVRRYGYAQAELEGSMVLDLAHPEDRDGVAEGLLRFFENGSPGLARGRALRFRTRDGDWRWVEASPILTRDAAGRPVEITAVLRDITERKSALEAIVASEARFRVIAENATDIIIQFGADQKIRYASPACRLLGYTPDDLVGRPVGALIYPGDLPMMRAKQAERLQAGPDAGPMLIECRIVKADGGASWVEGSTATVRDEVGQPDGAVTVLRLIDDRKAAADAIAESEARYRMLADATTDIIARYRLDETIEFVSPAVRQLGYAPEDLIGAKVSDLLHPDDRAVAASRRDVAATGAPLAPRPLRVRHADGHWVWMEGGPAAILDASGAAVAITASLRDVSDRVAAQKELAASEAQFRLLAENASDVISRCDPNGVVTYISPSVRRVLGYEPEELVGAKAFKLINPDEGAWVAAHLGEAIKAGVSGPLPAFEYRVVKKSGEMIWIEASPSIVRDPDTGRLLELQDTMRDVSARKAMEEELRRKHAEAEAAAVAKADFLANISHELRTPLTGIIGFSSLLEQVEALPPTARTFVHRITSSSRALLGMVSDILDFSKMDAGQIVLDPQRVDPAAILGEAIEVVSAQADAKSLAVRLQIDGELPDHVRLDGPRLRQVLLNLLSNAVKFTAEGEIVVRASHAPVRGGVLTVSVRDTGAGIPEGRAEHLFERFTQADSSVSRRHGGTGLGLAICKALVELMGGAIGVQSIEGQGSTFTFEVLAPVAPPPAKAATPAPMGTAPAAIGPNGARVLIADDVALNRELLKTILSVIDIEVTEAEDGLQAVELCRDTPFALVLMDLQMPHLGGLAAAQRIRLECPLNQDTPIVAVSANSAASDVNACLIAGMNDHIAKPIGAAELIEKVAYWTQPPASAA